MLWCRWRYGGEHPYRVYHGPSAQWPPPNRERVETFLAGFALYAHEVAMKAGGVK